MTDLLIWPADRLGVQLHIGRFRPQRDRFEVPRNAQAEMDYRQLFKPRGGLWTSSRTADGSSAALDTIAALPLAGYYPGRRIWRFKPKPDARVLVIDGPEHLAAITDRYPYQRRRPHPETTEIDFPAILADGYAAVHLTAVGATLLECDGTSPGMQSWHHESTIWLDFDAVGRVTEVQPERIQRDTTVDYKGQTYEVRYTPAFEFRFPADRIEEFYPRRDGAMTRWQLAAWAACQIVEWNVSLGGEVVEIEHTALQRLPGPFLDAVLLAVLTDNKHIVERRRPAIERFNAWIEADQRNLRPLRPEKRKKAS